MAIRNDKYGGSDFTEEGLKPSDFNDTIDATYDQNMRVYGTDLTGGAKTGTGDEKLSEVSIAGGKVVTYILVSFWCNSRNLSTSQHIQADIRIGESGSEASVTDSPITLALSTGTSDSISGTIGRTIEYYYEPTTDEKTNGFNVQIFGIGGALGDIEIFQTIIKGA